MTTPSDDTKFVTKVLADNLDETGDSGQILRRPITRSLDVPFQLASYIEQQALKELINAGYGRLGIGLDDLPGLHFAKTVAIGPDLVRVTVPSRTAPGSNILFMPMPYINDDGKRVISGDRTYAQRFSVSTDRTLSGSAEISDPWNGSRITLEVAFDPDGVDLRERWINLLPQAVISAEIRRSKNPLRRLARAIGF